MIVMAANNPDEANDPHYKDLLAKRQHFERVTYIFVTKNQIYAFNTRLTRV